MGRHTLTIGITTFNRRQILEAVAQSLARVDGLEHAHVWVLDDCSKEFGADVLQRLFPRAEVFRATRHSGGADQAMVRLFERFVATGSGYLLNLDADLLASRGLVDQCLRIIGSADTASRRGLYSIFNTASHPAVGTDGEFLLKRSVGAAGTLWQHGLLAEVLRNVPVSRKFDWDWSAYLTRQAIPIRVTRQSYVQHIGRIGQHSRSLTGMDHGVAFDGYEEHNLAVFFDHTHEALLQMHTEQNARQGKLAEAIIEVTRVVQSQARLIHELTGGLCALDQVHAEPMPMIAEHTQRLDNQREAIVQLSQVIQSQARLVHELIAEVGALQRSTDPTASTGDELRLDHRGGVAKEIGGPGTRRMVLE
jgi:glycosyl transferase family 2